jgi:hypothetical protein
LEFKDWMTHPGGDIKSADDLIAHWSTLGFVRKQGGPQYVVGDVYLDDRPSRP